MHPVVPIRFCVVLTLAYLSVNESVLMCSDRRCNVHEVTINDTRNCYNCLQ